MVFLVIASAAVGLLWGRVPAAVTHRVFREGPPRLLAFGDFARPLSLDLPTMRAAVAMQVTCGGLFALAAAVVGTRWVLPAYLWFVAVTLVLTVTDIDRKLIPNRILFPGFGLGAALLIVGGMLDASGGDLLRAAAGSAAYFSFLLLVALAARGGFGMGDVKLGAMLGAFLAFEGWAVFVVGVVGAFILGGAVSLGLLLLRIKSRKDAIPFGPYLVLGAYVALAAGQQIADWYTG